MIRLYNGGRLAEVKIQGSYCVSEFTEEESKPYKAIRGRITKWSRKSQMRLKLALAQLKQDELKDALEITLTYPKEFPPADDHRTYKRHLTHMNIFLARLGFKGAWKLEFQSRGAPHYHLLVMPDEKLEGLTEFRARIAKQWFRIVKSGDPKHYVAGTEVSPIKSPEGIIGYMASYMAKKDQTLPNNFTGRYWGFIQKKKLPLVNPKEIPLGRDNALTIRRIFRKKIQNDMKNYQMRILSKVLQKETGLKRKTQEIVNAFFRLDAKTGLNADERKLQEVIKRGWIKHPKKWRLRNNRVTRMFCNPDVMEACLIRLFSRRKRSLQNEGFLP